MTPSARLQTAIDLLDEIIPAATSGGAAADTLITRWFKTRRYAGSKDRRAVRDHVYAAIRAFGDPPATGRAAMIGLVETGVMDAALFDGTPHGPAAIGPAERGAVPSPLPRWLGEAAPDWLDAAEADALLARAPLDLRINALKPVPELEDAIALPGLPQGRRVPENSQMEQHPAFLAGQIEIQDSGSQHIAQLCGAQPGQLVVDLCAGAGGKTLALAADMGNDGRLIACDTDRNRLSRMVPRAERAGASMIEARLLNPNEESEALADLTGMADTVLVDAPCTGSGTWRRNPEARWRMSAQWLSRITALQAHVLALAAPLVKPGGALVYAVCSVLDEEGADQISRFLASHPGWVAHTPDIGRPRGSGALLTPAHDGTDGFYVARLAKPC